MTAAPYRVKDADHWCFAGTGLKNGDTFGREESAHANSGRSVRTRNGQNLSAVSGQPKHLAKGLNPDDGGAEIVIHEPEAVAVRLFRRIDLLAGMRAGG